MRRSQCVAITTVCAITLVWLAGAGAGCGPAPEQGGPGEEAALYPLDRSDPRAWIDLDPADYPDAWRPRKGGTCQGGSAKCEAALRYDVTDRIAAPVPTATAETLSAAARKALQVTGSGQQVFSPASKGLDGLTKSPPADEAPAAEASGNKASGSKASGSKAPGDGIGTRTQAMIFGLDQQKLVVNTTTWPARAVVKLFIDWPNNDNGGCSGTLIGPKAVLTAGHCVHQLDKGGWATAIRVVPGYDDGYMPYGDAQSVTIHSVTGWTSSEDENYDYALITLNRRLGDYTGYLGLGSLKDSTLDSFYVEVHGYPNTPDDDTDVYDSVHQFYSSNPILSHNSTMIYHRADTLPGTSGAGYHGLSNSSYKNVVFGVHSGAIEYWLADYNGGPRITSSRYYQISGWRSADLGLAEVSGRFVHWSNMGGTTLTRPSSVSYKSGTYDVFMRGTDGQVYFKTHHPSGFWPSSLGWQSIGSNISGSVAAVSRANDQIDLFARSATTSRLCTKARWTYYWWPTYTDGWYCFNDTHTAVSPSAVANPSPGAPGTLGVFGATSSGEVFYKYWSGQSWAATQYLGGNTADPVAAITRGPGTFDLFIRDQDTNQICTKSFRGIYGWWPAGKTWHCFNTKTAVAPSAVSAGASSIDVLGVGGKGNVVGLHWDGSDWTSYSLGGNVTGKVAAISRAPNQIDIFVRGTSGRIYTKARHNSTWWPSQTGNYYNLDGDMVAIDAVSFAANRIDIFARANNGSVYRRWWDGSKWWM